MEYTILGDSKAKGPLRPLPSLAAAFSVVLTTVLSLVAPAPAATAQAAATGTVLGGVPIDTPHVNGTVWATAYGGDTVYLGGDFTAVIVAGRAHVRAGLAAFDAATGALLPWAPVANGRVRAIAADGDHVHIAGSFSQMNGLPRDSLASVTVESGTVLPFRHFVSGQPYSVAVHSGRLYIGGAFTAVDGQSRGNLAAFNLATGLLDPAWRPTADDHVNGLAINSGRLYVGGKFHTIDGQRGVRRIAALNPATGAIDPGFRSSLVYAVIGLGVNQGGVYAAVAGPGGRLTAMAHTGAVRWSITTDGDPQAVALLDGIVYVGGHFDNVCRTSRVASTNGDCLDGRTTRVKLAAVTEDGVLTPWIADGNGVTGVHTLTADPTRRRLAAGGAFTTINREPRARFAQFA
ncbi:hypothetical protein [Pilimelia columellifera]|uniref:Pyrroloquinoline-quinone binding quinoprotein n=1 Tax=Pilimelia columellifera subsp. columellifera TaxID=706583 RepID=A0ABP6ALZ1_9ACTN